MTTKTKTNTPIEVPEGFMQNSQGAMVLIDHVDPIDKLRDKLVHSIRGKAEGVENSLAQFRSSAYDDIESFLEKSAKKFGTKFGGNKGNLTLTSYDGKIRIKISVNDVIRFDERLQVAINLIHECLDDWSNGIDPKLKSIIDRAFEKDNEGNAIPSRLLGLKKLNINDPKWRRAMKALTLSQYVESRKPYFNIYEKDENGEFQIVPLDMAKLPALGVLNANKK